MAFCKFSTENRMEDDVLVNSNFFAEYMPSAPEMCTKVYLYGLYKCHNADELTNTIDDFSKTLNLSYEDIKSAFLYWQDEGLVTILNLNPIEVRYLPIKEKRYDSKLFKKEKYAEFNRSIQEIIDGRMITPHEYKEYYLTMESLHIDDSAMLMIAKYCTNQKGNNVGYNYILTVAKNWAYDGIHTSLDVEKKLEEMENITSKVKDILLALKSKKTPSFEDRELYQKWTKQYGYDDLTLLAIAKLVKKGGIEKMSAMIDIYVGLNLFSTEEIKDYEKNKDDLYNTAKTVCKSLGLYYDNLDPVVNTYILKWKQMGYEDEVIKFVANICFKKFIRTFDKMDEIICKYFANGLVSYQAIQDYISTSLELDKKIKSILENLQINRQVTSWDRDFYNTWKNVWLFDDEIIDYAVTLGAGKSQPMIYINKILSNWKENNIKTLEQAKQTNLDIVPAKKAEIKKEEFVTHSFSSEELNALFDNLDEVKLL